MLFLPMKYIENEHIGNESLLTARGINGMVPLPGQPTNLVEE